MLSAFEELSSVEIAAVLDVTESSVRSRLFRARNLLAELLNHSEEYPMSFSTQNEFDRSAGAIDAEKTLRLIASLPAPEGIEDRVKTGSARRSASNQRDLVAALICEWCALHRESLRCEQPLPLRLFLWWRAEDGKCIRISGLRRRLLLSRHRSGSMEAAVSPLPGPSAHPGRWKDRWSLTPANAKQRSGEGNAASASRESTERLHGCDRKMQITVRPSDRERFCRSIDPSSARGSACRARPGSPRPRMPEPIRTRRSRSRSSTPA